MRLIGSFQTITIQGTSGSATSSCSGARSRAGAVVLMLLMTPMVAKPRWERKAGRDRPPPHVGGPGGDRRRLSPARKVMPARSRCSSKGITVLRVVPRVALAAEDEPSGGEQRLDHLGCAGRDLAGRLGGQPGGQGLLAVMALDRLQHRSLRRVPGPRGPGQAAGA